MNFADWSFWQNFFCGLVVILPARYLLIRFYGDRAGYWDRLLLATLSLYLLSCVNKTSFVIFCLLAILNYGCLQISHRLPGRRRLAFLFFVIPLHLIPLFYYKYSSFFVNKVIGFQDNLLENLVIPAGISFYTFQKIALLVDFYKSNDTPPPFINYLNFSGFFPLTVAGPIERVHTLLPQIEKFRFRWVSCQINEAIPWIVLGLFYKLALSDNLTVFLRPDMYVSPWQIWHCSLLFGLKIYFDFSGYSLIALGIARGIGIQLTLNFKSPYLSTSLKEFWTTWHVTLSSWFRDYIYFPLGGSRTRFWAFNIILVFFISGIWHGAGWNYIIWGLILGIFTVISHLLRKIQGFALLGWLMTMLVVFFAWTAFYEIRIDVLCAKYQILLNPADYLTFDGFNTFHFAFSDFMVEVVLLSLCLGVFVLEYFSLRKGNGPYQLLRHPAVTVLLVFITMLIAPVSSNEFIYFSF